MNLLSGTSVPENVRFSCCLPKVLEIPSQTCPYLASGLIFSPFLSKVRRERRREREDDPFWGPGVIL
jgi:hypothetical protein